MKKEIIKIIMLPFTPATFTTKFSQTIKKKKKKNSIIVSLTPLYLSESQL